jgi:hypothetical protein
VCGCNQAFDLKPTKLVDAPPAVEVDAAPPPACPALGTVPRFSDDLRQIPPRQCDAYAVSDNKMAMAICAGTIMRGPADGDLSETITMDMTYAYDAPRLAPDGNHVFISHSDLNTFETTFVDFALAGTSLAPVGEYVAPHDTTGYGETFDISTPSRGPDRHIVYSDFNNTMQIWELVEIADRGGTEFTEVARYPLSELGSLTTFARPALSPDGLRVIFLNMEKSFNGGPMPYGSLDLGGGGLCGYLSSVLMYADRASTADHFRMAQVIDTIPDQIDWPYMTEDCGRIYVSALNRIFYFKQ